MRLKIFTAATLSQAMTRVRREMGEDAIIVSTQVDARGARVTAAMEEPDLSPDILAEAAERDNEDLRRAHNARQSEAPSQTESPYRQSSATASIEEEIGQALNFHGVPRPLAHRLIRAAAMANATGALTALAGALDQTFGFNPLSPQIAVRPLMLVGPCGAGKTLTVAKLATRARRAGRTATVITTDTRRAGGVEQLEAFTRILGIELIAAASPVELATALRRCNDAAADGPVLIDTAGANPFIGGDINRLGELAEVAAAEAILVLPAGGDAMEMMDSAAAFASLRLRRLLATRLDAVRRLGGLLAAAESGRMSFSDGGISHHAADSLVPLSPVALSRAILPHAVPNPAPTSFSEALP